MKQKPVYLPEDLHRKLKIIAIDKNKTMSEMLADILERSIINKKILVKK